MSEDEQGEREREITAYLAREDRIDRCLWRIAWAMLATGGVAIVLFAMRLYVDNQ